VGKCRGEGRQKKEEDKMRKMGEGKTPQTSTDTGSKKGKTDNPREM